MELKKLQYHLTVCKAASEPAMDFSQIGILAGISAILAENKISIFAVSTFNTDYILVKEELLRRRFSCWRQRDIVSPVRNRTAA